MNPSSWSQMKELTLTNSPLQHLRGRWHIKIWFRDEISLFLFSPPVFSCCFQASAVARLTAERRGHSPQTKSKHRTSSSAF